MTRSFRPVGPTEHWYLEKRSDDFAVVRISARKAAAARKINQRAHRHAAGATCVRECETVFVNPEHLR